tara:strand:+ start:558 stop:2408 length:1851 start_codon:yes stop_codon:yes gene_type:complete
MSLLDDVSIVVTPNGYKAGTLYGVLPTATEGSELVVNGGFATDSDWTKGTGWTISGGKANSDGTQSVSYLRQNGIVNLTSTYKVQFTVSGSTSGTLNFLQGNGSTAINITSNNTYNYFVNWDGSSGDIVFQSLNFVGSVDNVSVKEFTASDMDVTRATAATRVDENGLVNYAEVLGSEEISCGNFECANPNGVWNRGTGWGISGGTATYDGSGGTQAISQSIANIQLGTFCKVTIDVLSNQGSGNNTIFLGGTVVNSSHLDVGSYTFYGSFTSNTNLYIYGRSGEVFEIDNISIKEADRNNVPRIDYTGGGCPHILAEPQRTNLLPYSEDLSQWNLKQGTETLNYGISPDGTQNSTRIVFSGANLQFSNIFTTVTPTVGSIFIKGVNGETINFGLDSSETIFTLNGSWQRFEKSGTSTSNKITINTFGGATARDIQVYGGQVEGGTYATSYIPTSGSAVTRNQDVFTRDGIASLINSPAGVLFVEMAALSDDNTDRRLSLNDGSQDNQIVIGYSRFTGKVVGEVFSGGSIQNIDWGATGVTQTNNNKFALSWGSGTMKFYTNGSQTNIETGISSPTGLNYFRFSYGDSTTKMFAKVKQLQVYKTALTDTQLAALTS